MTRQIFCKVLLVVVAIFGLFLLSGVLLAQGRSDWALEHVKEVQERNTERLMAMNGVEGTAIGFNPNARMSVVVLLERPGVGGIPQELEGIAVHPVVTGKIYALKPPTNKPGRPPKEPEEPIDPTARFDRPVPIGVSTGHPAITAGTIGCKVTNGTNVYALSNNHVYADENNAEIGDAVIQPGKYDGGLSPADDIGTLYAYVGIDFAGGDNSVDAAIALCEGTLGNATPSDGYGTPKSEIAAVYINQPVKKYGRTTGLTKGRVFAVNAIVNVGYDSGVARFVNQIIITPGSFSAGGDSGSLVVVDGKGRNKSQDRKPVGLLFAGSDLITIANPIDVVLDAFNVAIDGE